MAETMAPARSSQPTPQPFGFWRGVGSSGLWFAVLVVLLIVGTGCYVLGWNSAQRENVTTKKQLEDLQVQNTDLSKKNNDLQSRIGILEQQARTAQNHLRDVFLAYKTIEINANDSTFVSGAHFSVGLVGPPATDRVNINVNGQQHSAAVGDTIDVGKISASCRVTVSSFDMFKASVTTNCTPANP